jgi:hypothetical protein
VKTAGGELAGAAEPKLQQALGMDDAQFKQYVAQEMPGIAKFDAQAPGVVALVGPVIGKMQAVRPDYTKASAIPVSWLPLTSAPWLFLGIGLLLIAVAAYALWRPGTLASRQDPARADPLDVHHPGLRACDPRWNHVAPGTAHRGRVCLGSGATGGGRLTA